MTERIVARPVSAWVRVRARVRVRDRGKVRVRDRGKVRGSGRGRGERLPAHDGLELVQYHVEHLVRGKGRGRGRGRARGGGKVRTASSTLSKINRWCL